MSLTGSALAAPVHQAGCGSSGLGLLEPVADCPNHASAYAQLADGTVLETTTILVEIEGEAPFWRVQQRAVGVADPVYDDVLVSVAATPAEAITAATDQLATDISAALA